MHFTKFHISKKNKKKKNKKLEFVNENYNYCS